MFTLFFEFDSRLLTFINQLFGNMEDGEKSSVCTFSFKKRKAASMRRKQSQSSEEDETVVTRSDKKETLGVLSAKTV